MNETGQATVRGQISIKNRQRLKVSVISAISIAVFLIIWAAISSLLNLVYLPGPLKVFEAFVHSFTSVEPSLGTNMWGNIWASLRRFGMGFIIAFGLAIPLGLLMGFFPTLEIFAKPIIEIFRPIPPIAWVPVFLLVFALFWGPVAVIFIGVFFPLLSSVIFGVKSVDKNLVDAAKTLGANRRVLFSKVVFPYTIPYLMTGVTIGLGIGWMCIVAAEIIGAVGGGVGYYIDFMQQLGKYPSMYAGMVVIAILGIVTVGVSRYIEGRLTKQMGMK